MPIFTNDLSLEPSQEFDKPGRSAGNGEGGVGISDQVDMVFLSITQMEAESRENSEASQGC